MTLLGLPRGNRSPREKVVCGARAAVVPGRVCVCVCVCVGSMAGPSGAAHHAHIPPTLPPKPQPTAVLSKANIFIGLHLQNVKSQKEKPSKANNDEEESQSPIIGTSVGQGVCV